MHSQFFGYVAILSKWHLVLALLNFCGLKYDSKKKINRQIHKVKNAVEQMGLLSPDIPDIFRR